MTLRTGISRRGDRIRFDSLEQVLQIFHGLLHDIPYLLEPPENFRLLTAKFTNHIFLYADTGCQILSLDYSVSLDPGLNAAYSQPAKRLTEGQTGQIRYKIG